MIHMTRIGRAPVALGLIAVLALAVAACSSTPAATSAPPTAAPATAAPATAAPTGGLTGAASGLPGGLGSLAIPSFGDASFHGAPDLEARLPAQVCGTNAFKLSFSAGGLGAAAAAAAGGDLQSILSAIGPGTTFTMAIAAPDPTSSTTCGTSIFAMQVQGGDPSQVLGLIQASAAKEGGTTKQASLAGKGITELVDSGGATTYMYVSGDTIFGVSADDDNAAGEALALLP